jgi:hypothetical protein
MNDNTNKSSAISQIESIVCAYACPSTDFHDTPFAWPEIVNIGEKKDIEYFKRKFISLLKDMENEHGVCTSVHIEHSMGEISVQINY